MSGTTIRFHFDCVSPNADLAWTQLKGLADRHGVDIESVPVLFSGLLDAHGRVGSAEVPVHIRWMWKNVLRKAALLRVAMNPPTFHPFNPLLALRVSSLPVPASERTRLIDALFQAVWVRGLHFSDPGVVEEIARGVGLAGPARYLRRPHDDRRRRDLPGVRRFPLSGALPRRERSPRSEGVAEVVRSPAAVGGSRETAWRKNRGPSEGVK